MTSPTPDAAALDSKLAPGQEQGQEQQKDANGTISKESKLESPKAETSPASEPEKSIAKSEEEPADAKSSDDVVPNGVATLGKDAPTETPLKTEDDASSSKSEEKPTPVVAEKVAEKEAEKIEDKPVEEHRDEDKAVKAEEAAQPEDVTMTDVAEPSHTPAPYATRDEPAKPSPEPKSPAKPDDATADKAVSEEPPKVSEADKQTLASAPAPEKPISEAPAAASPVETSIEVAMTDVSTSKVSRERDEDSGDEPAAKRARTEPKEEEPTASGVGTPAPAADSVNRLSSLSKWEDPETDNKPLTLFQRREIRKTIARVKKTKHGGHFRDSVPKLWPQLGESYLARIDKPMDLSEIDRRIRDPEGAYATLGDLRKDLSLIYENTMAFNGATHEITGSAFYAIRAVWQEALLVPEEEPTRPKSVAKPKPLRDPRSFSGTDALVRRQSSGPVSSPPREVPEPKSRPAPSQETQGADRRGSTATDVDRPKRTVRAPKPKDIDYTKPLRKKLKPELQFCDEVLAELMHPKNQLLNTWFMDAVDAEGLNIPDYYSIIKKPMDLGKVSRLLGSGEITSLKEFDKTVRLIFTNCYQFNGPPEQGNPVSLTAKQLEDFYNQQMKGKDAWLSRYAKANAPAASVSNASDEEDEDESDDGGDVVAPGVDYSKEVQEYSSKLEEESKKLNSMFASGAQQSLVDCQKVIVEALQGAVYKAAQALNEAKPKQDKASKKSSKSSKTKTSSHPTHRKSLSALPPAKKPSGTKKPAPKKSLTAADKDAIASAINDLEANDLDNAIDIIKRDTGQNENNDGELELDIDQLSTIALLKLWDLCKKVLPGFGKSSAPTKSPEVSKATPAKATPKSASKPKKNKPMSAQEQEARIAQLTAISQMYRGGMEPSDNAARAPSATASSDDSSEEE